MSKDAEIIFEEKGGVGLITLNRPDALNALNLDMIREMSPKLDEWKENSKIYAVVLTGAGDRAFCAGGDVKAVALDAHAMQNGQSEGQLTRDFFREEYPLNHQIFHYPKPYISLIDGIVMGGGKGLSAHGSHRVVTENTLFAMPETGIGFFPDVGGSYFLPRAPGESGLYLALTSARINAVDALYIGFGTHYLPQKGLEPLLENLTTADWNRADPLSIANAILSNYSSENIEDEGILRDLQKDIDRHFRFDTVEKIVESLQGEEENTEWAKETLKALEERSPTSLKVTLAQIRRGEKMEFDDAMVMEYRLSQRFMQSHDFYEGIRAQLIDKDRAPKWDPATLEDIAEEDVDAFFEPLQEGELTF